MRPTSQTGTKVGVSFPLSIHSYKRVVSAALSDKSYAGDNRLIAPNSPHRRRCLAPRCRLVLSWSRSMFQGFGCSPIKRVRELGSERKLHCVLLLRSSNIPVYIAPMVLKSDYIGETRMDHPNGSKGNTEGRLFVCQKKK